VLIRAATAVDFHLAIASGTFHFLPSVELLKSFRMRSGYHAAQ
jgi:hypothetical protein